MQNCYSSAIVYPENASDGPQRDNGYFLIPRASQSVKVLGEVPLFIIMLFQVYKPNLQDEVNFPFNHIIFDFLSNYEIVPIVFIINSIFLFFVIIILLFYFFNYYCPI